MKNKVPNYRQEFSLLESADYRFKDLRLVIKSSVHLSQLNYKKSLTCSVLSQSVIYNDIPLMNAFNIIQQEKKLLQCLLEQANENYGVWLCDQGIWKLIILDQEIPIQNSPSTIITDHEWPILFEKAIVKLFDPDSGYEVLNKLVNYSIEPFLYMLTGQQSELASIKTFNELQSQLGQQNLFYVLKLKKRDQICYAIVEAQIQEAQELVRLRATNKDQVQLVQGARQIDGNLFYLEWKDFQSNFPQIYYIKWVQEHKNHAFKLEHPTQRQMKTHIENTYVYSFKVDKEVTLQVLLCQRDQNMNTKTQQQYCKYALCRLAFFKHKGEMYYYIGGKLDNQQNISLNLKFTPGEEYIMFCQAYFSFEHVAFQQALQTTLNIQFQGEQVPKELKLAQYHNKPNLLLSLINENKNVQNTRTYASFGQPKVQVTTQTHLGLLIFYYLNLGTASIDEQVDFEESENLLNYETLTPQNSFRVNLDPLTRDHMVVYCFDPEVLNRKNGFSFKYKLQITQNLSLSNSQKPVPSQKNSHQVNQEDRDQEITNLTSLIKEKGRRSHFNEQDITMYVLQHDAGVIMLFENESNKILQYKADVFLDNLYINCAKELIVDNQLKFDLEKKKNQFIYLDIIDRNMPYEYRIQNQYSLASNKY